MDATAARASTALRRFDFHQHRADREGTDRATAKARNFHAAFGGGRFVLPEYRGLRIRMRPINTPIGSFGLQVTITTAELRRALRDRTVPRKQKNQLWPILRYRQRRGW